jgi:predicted nucleic acid-binding Zn ribbon protein
MSKRKEEWGPHSHCVICGRAIPEGEKTCSEECKKKYEEELKRYKQQQTISYIFIIIMIVFILVLFLFPYFR